MFVQLCYTKLQYNSILIVVQSRIIIVLMKFQNVLYII